VWRGGLGGKTWGGRRKTKDSSCEVHGMAALYRQSTGCQLWRCSRCLPAWIWLGPQPVLLVASDSWEVPRWEKR
jgi:hypothetical protein